MENNLFKLILNNEKQKNIHLDAIFIEWCYLNYYISVFAEKINDFIISELNYSEDFEITENQYKILQKIVNSFIIEENTEEIDSLKKYGLKEIDFY